jgi:hypothetical protein
MDEKKWNHTIEAVIDPTNSGFWKVSLIKKVDLKRVTPMENNFIKVKLLTG